MRDEEVCCKVYAISGWSRREMELRGRARFYGPFRFTFLVKNARAVVTLVRKSWTEESQNPLVD